MPGASCSVPAVVRKRVEAQGFLNLDDRTIAQINYWLRLSLSVCMTWTAIGTALGFPCHDLDAAALRAASREYRPGPVPEVR